MSSGLCDCFLLRRHGAATTAIGATAATSRGPSGGRESKAHSQEALMSQDLVYREISVNSLSDPQHHLAEPASEPKQELFVPDFTPFQTSSLLIESSHSSKTLEKSNEKKKNTNIAKEMKTRLSFLLQRPDSSSGDQNMQSENSLEVAERSGRPTPHEAQEWGRSLEALLSYHNQPGLPDARGHHSQPGSSHHVLLQCCPEASLQPNGEGLLPEVLEVTDVPGPDRFGAEIKEFVPRLSEQSQARLGPGPSVGDMLTGGLSLSLSLSLSIYTVPCMRGAG
ncbi:uncharacterized protein LOC120540008 isoform X2 [Polypterus senegalus]|uniref:uncharacterized protein LOC120540008 isoform X2 n=1 Tax=Polypterus senegalus TaxID=55291 RepID=UPI001962A8E9|nr:uncharacterized protein LOC120540008 isoform X2 [Polypterus senegalus]